jgi:hypothetical protein
MDTLVRIARCSEADNARSDNNHPCNTIVTSQKGASFQLPEPWNGDIFSAEVLFVASNPSYNPDEVFPDAGWNDNDINKFFINRFDVDYYKKIRYFRFMLKYASWILNCEKDAESLPGRICITEIVHCKSQHEKGVSKCSECCFNNWFSEVLELFNGKYIVLLGKFAEGYKERIREKSDIEPIIMPHPNARGVKDEERQNIVEKWKSSNRVC